MLSDEQPDNVRVTLSDGSRVVLEEPAVSGDTLSALDDGTPVHIPLANVADVAIKKTNALKTTAFIYGTLVVGFAIAAVIFCASYDCSS